MINREYKMPKDWSMTLLEEVADINNFTIDKNYPFNEIEYIDVASVSERQLSQTQKLKLKSAPSRAKRIVKNNSILISTVRPNLKHYCYIEEAKPNLIASTGFAVINAKEGVANGFFIYYLLTTKDYTDYLVKIADSHTSTYPAFNPSVISNSKFLLPPYCEQCDIASILSALDSKIELLREQNKTLEATAQTIFKEWFVNFNFPGATGKMVDSELGEIPEGWRVGKLAEIVSKEKNAIVDGPFGTQMKIAEYQDSGIPVIEMDFLENSFITKKFRHFLSSEKFNQVKRSCAQGGDIIISKTGTLGLLGILPDDFDKAIIVSRIAKITPSKKLNNRLFIYQFLNFLQKKKYWDKISSGSTMPTFNLTHIKEVRVLIPEEDLYSKFEQTLSPVYKKMLINKKQIQTLSSLRDTLLPKLMKGEIRVKGFSK